MFDLKDGLKTAMDLASKVGGKDLDITKLITDQFVNENTSLSTVKELLGKVGINSLTEVQEKIPQLEAVLKQVSSFGSWKDFLAKATEAYLKK